MNGWRRSALPRELKCGILHLGLGAFHRAHQAAFTEDAIAATGGNWGIVAVAMRNPQLADILSAQQGRFTLIERHPDGPHLQQITAIRRTLALPRDPGAVLAGMADPDIHIVTVTVTEKGYGVIPGSRDLDPDHPAIAHDLARPQDPRGLIGVIVAGLGRRRAIGGSGLTLMSCDNLPDNGAVLRALVLNFAARVDPGLAGWIEATCRFPATMVDRITPAATPDTRRLATEITRQPDEAAVETEPFRQWVIEDSFAGPRPAWEAAGALIVSDVAPFEAMKLRMLNGAHSLIAYIGTNAGLNAVRDVMADPVLAALVRRHMEAAAATLDPTADLDPATYADALIARFANPAIEHRCAQIAMDGSQKLPQRIFAPARILLDRGQPVDSFALATALWLRHVETRVDAMPLDDPMAGDLRSAMARGPATDCVTAVGALPGLAGNGLFDDPGWVRMVAQYLESLRETGLQDTLDISKAG